MNEKYDQEIALRLIANTRRKKRPDSIVKIAGYIRKLESDVGSLKAVSEIPGIDISEHMLRQFLSVERLCPEVKKLVEERKIDRINVVHYMRNFDPEAQKTIAKEVIAERLSANDVRVLAPLLKSLSGLTVEQLISKVIKSKNIKIYVAYFRVPPELKDDEALRRRFEDIVGESEVKSLTVEDHIGTLELTTVGQKMLREAAKQHKLSLRKFVDTVVHRQVEGELLHE